MGHLDAEIQPALIKKMDKQMDRTRMSDMLLQSLLSQELTDVHKSFTTLNPLVFIT